MSKALTALFTLLVVASASSALDDARNTPAHRFALAAAVAVLVVVLAGLFLTRREIDVDHRRGEGLEDRPGLFSWFIALPLLAVSAVMLVVSLLIALGTNTDPIRSLRLRRVARHAWRTWVLVIVGAIITGFVIDELDGDAPVTFAMGCVALAATRLGTRWMDRSDAAHANAASDDTRVGTSATSELPSPIQLG